MKVMNFTGAAAMLMSLSPLLDGNEGASLAVLNWE